MKLSDNFQHFRELFTRTITASRYFEIKDGKHHITATSFLSPACKFASSVDAVRYRSRRQGQGWRNRPPAELGLFSQSNNITSNTHRAKAPSFNSLTVLPRSHYLSQQRLSSLRRNRSAMKGIARSYQITNILERNNDTSNVPRCAIAPQHGSSVQATRRTTWWTCSNRLVFMSRLTNSHPG